MEEVFRNMNVIRNIIRGIGSIMSFGIIDFPHPRINYSINESDFEALRQDWIKIGNDLSTAIEEVKNCQQALKECSSDVIENDGEEP